MQLSNDLLYILEQKKGEPISGEDLAARLNVSRAAIWKAIKELQNNNHDIIAVKRKGYTLQKSSDVLSKQAILPHLNYALKNAQIVAQNDVSSTNIIAKELGANGAGHGSLIIANSQSAGRGRLGRAFSSPQNTGLYLSIILRKNLSLQNAASVTCAAAVATCRAIKALSKTDDIQIKWVNDLYKNGKKCCGILCEATADIQTGGIDFIVVGIGVNVKIPTGGFDGELKEIATSVFAQNEEISRAQLAAYIANELMKICDDMPNNSFMQEYKQRSFILGKNIVVLQNDTKQEAVAKSITDEGHLIVIMKNGEEKTLTYGEVSVKIDK